MANRHEISARALRLVLARLTDQDDWEAFDATLAEFGDDPDQLRAAVQFLAGLTAGTLTAARGHAGAIADITHHIAEQLDTSGEDR